MLHKQRQSNKVAIDRHFDLCLAMRYVPHTLPKK